MACCSASSGSPSSAARKVSHLRHVDRSRNAGTAPSSRGSRIESMTCIYTVVSSRSAALIVGLWHVAGAEESIEEAHRSPLNSLEHPIPDDAARLQPSPHRQHPESMVRAAHDAYRSPHIQLGLSKD